MENSPAFFIIGTLLVLTLTFTTGSYIQKSAESTIEESLSSMSTQEIEAFNNQFESYLGKQTGSQISSLCGRLIANSKTYEDDPTKVPSVECKIIGVNMTEGVDVSYDVADEDSRQEYIEALNTIKNHIENKHIYYVEAQYDLDGILEKLIINYEVPEETNKADSNTQESVKSTAKESSSGMLKPEIESFNNQFYNYRGKQTGSQISSLCGRLIANINTYKDEPKKVPSVECKMISVNMTEGVEISYDVFDEDNYQEYLGALKTIKDNIENKHTYYVDFKYDQTGLMNKIVIGYEELGQIY